MVGTSSLRRRPWSAWHLRASTQAPGSPSPARRAKVAATTAPPLARRRRLRVPVAGRGGRARRAAGPFARVRVLHRLGPVLLGPGSPRKPGLGPQPSSSCSPTGGMGCFHSLGPPGRKGEPGPSGPRKVEELTNPVKRGAEPLRSLGTIRSLLGRERL